MQLSVTLYRFTANFPHDELFGLTRQLREAGVSVATNIADGWSRQVQGEYKKFLGDARSSNLEIQTLLVVATELGFGNVDLCKTAEALSQDVAKMLHKLMSKFG